jgi:hypothetical protein
MIPRTLTASQAQQLLARGRARQQSPECLTTPTRYLLLEQ